MICFVARADQSTRSPRDDRGSVSPTVVLDGYSADMVSRLKSTSDRIVQSSQQGTFRATPTVISTHTKTVLIRGYRGERVNFELMKQIILMITVTMAMKLIQCW